jgi:hypothetical protein
MIPLTTEEFKAVDEAGNVYVVVVQRSAIDANSLDRSGSLLGLPDFRLFDGRRLNRIAENVFQIAQTGLQIVRV